MATVRILVGPIASGKSTFALKEAERGAVVVNDDAIVCALAGGKYEWKKVHSRIYKAVELAIAQAALLRRLDVVIDKPNFSRSQRRRWIGLAHALDALAVGVVFPRSTPEIHARRRLAADDRGRNLAYWLRATRRHDALYQPPDLSEDFDELIELSPEHVRVGTIVVS